MEKPIINALVERNRNYNNKNSINIDMKSFFFKYVERPLVEFSKISLKKSYTIDFSDYENQLNFDVGYISKTLEEKGFYTSWDDYNIFIMWVRDFENNESDLLCTVRKNQSSLACIKIKDYVYNDMFKDILKNECCENRINIDLPSEFKYEDYIEILMVILKKEDIYAEYNERSGDFYVYTFGTYNEVEMELDKYYDYGCHRKKDSWICRLNSFVNRLFA